MSAVIKPGTNWTGDYSRFTGLTAETKGYAALLKLRGKAVLDDEFNFLQEPILGLLTRAIREINVRSVTYGDNATINDVNVGWQIRFDPVIPKTADDRLTLRLGTSWGRYTPP